MEQNTTAVNHLSLTTAYPEKVFSFSQPRKEHRKDLMCSLTLLCNLFILPAAAISHHHVTSGTFIKESIPRCTTLSAGDMHDLRREGRQTPSAAGHQDVRFMTTGEHQTQFYVHQVIIRRPEITNLFRGKDGSRALCPLRSLQVLNDFHRDHHKHLLLSLFLDSSVSTR